MRSRLGDAARDVAEGKITLEEMTKAIINAIRDRNLRLADQGAFNNPPEQPITIELDMKAFNQSAMAIARGRERTAAFMRNARPLLSSNITNDILNSSVEGPVPSSPIAEPQLLAPTRESSAMTPFSAPEPPASVFTTVGANSMLQPYTTPSSVAHSTHRQRPAAHDPLSIPAQSQHWQANSAAFSEPPSTSQQQLPQLSAVQNNHGQHPAAHDSRTAAPVNPAALPTNLAAQVSAQPSTGRPVDYPLWEVPAPSSLMRWPLRSQHRRVDNLRLSTWRKQTTASSTNFRQPLISNHSQPTSTSAMSGALHPKSATAASCRAGSWRPRLTASAACRGAC